MSIYIQFVTKSQLISPVNGYTCKRITKQNIKQFGFKSLEDLQEYYPDFPTKCEEYREKQKRILSKASKIANKNSQIKSINRKNNEYEEYQKNPKLCPKCKNEKPFKSRNNKFCSRTCANSRGPRTSDFKETVSKKLKGKNFHKPEDIRARIISKGQIPSSDKLNTFCVVCRKDTGTKHRKTCSKECLKINAKINSQKNPKCGGQKFTHRSKIENIQGETFTAESSYEVELSKILNSLSIQWIRPKYFWYHDENNMKRRYYPDFYLPKFNLYLDPKNSYLIENDIDKIHRTVEENGISIVIIGVKKINKKSIKELVGNGGIAPPSHGCKPRVLLLN